jgi:hypothetical protein
MSRATLRSGVAGAQLIRPGFMTSATVIDRSVSLVELSITELPCMVGASVDGSSEPSDPPLNLVAGNPHRRSAASRMAISGPEQTVGRETTLRGRWPWTRS